MSDFLCGTCIARSLAIMPKDTFSLRFWGVRGSVATSGPEFTGVGGNTSCVEVRAGSELIILDAGTGLVRLGQRLSGPIRATFLFSHFHWDHIQGFPLFRPAFEAENCFTLIGPDDGACGIEGALRRQMEPPHFPVSISAMRAGLRFRSICPKEEIRVGRVRVRAAALNHPQGCLGYRISLGDRSIVYATDTEPLEPGILDPGVVELARGADLLIYDAQYTDDEYDGCGVPARRGWGHSTATEACRVAGAAGVRELALFHHDPGHGDDFIAAVTRQAQALFPATFAAREGMTVDLSAHDRGRRGALWDENPRSAGRTSQPSAA